MGEKPVGFHVIRDPSAHIFARSMNSGVIRHNNIEGGREDLMLPALRRDCYESYFAPQCLEVP